MPDAVFRERPAFGASVANRPITAAPPVGVPRGPSGFDCSVICPPEPPPQPTPLAVVSAVPDTWFGIVIVRVTFDAPPVVTGLPNWQHTGGDAGVGVAVGGWGPNDVAIAIDGAEWTSFTVPVNATGIHSASGGAVVPGTYPLV